MSAKCALSDELMKTMRQRRASVLSFNLRTSSCRSPIIFPCRLSSRARPNGSCPRMQMAKGAPGLLGGQSMNFAKLKRNAALSWYSLGESACATDRGATGSRIKSNANPAMNGGVARRHLGALLRCLWCAVVRDVEGKFINRSELPAQLGVGAALHQRGSCGSSRIDEFLVEALHEILTNETYRCLLHEMP